MGYTHYYRQDRDYTADEWADVQADLGQILKFAEHEQGIALRSWDGETGRPQLDADCLNFNGANDDSHENFMVSRVADHSFCKTARKPYDLAVVACLCYLSTVAENLIVTSDGKGADFVAGLEMARQALPRYSNRLDIPMGVMQRDRWCGPYFQMRSERYDFHCCVDGHAYILDEKTGKSYRFYSHLEAAQWANSHIEKPITVRSSWGTSHEGGKRSIFNAYGSFNQERSEALRKAQDRLCKAMLAKAEGDRAIPPPAFIRPGDMPAIDDSKRCYSLEDLLKLDAAA